MIGFGISTRNRKDQVLKCLEAVYRYAEQDSKIVIVDDGSEDGSPAAILQWIQFADAEQRITFAGRHERRGVAASKKAMTELLLSDSAVTDVILIEDDVLPLTHNWYECYLETAAANQQAHLLYLPSNWKYGRVSMTTGSGRTQIQWKQYCSAMVMYFKASLLRQVGSFDERFGMFGYEHNNLTARCLAAQGQNPEMYPHCVTAEVDKTVYATDVAETREKMAYHENAHKAKELTAKLQLAFQNRSLYDRLMVPIRAEFARNQSDSVRLREQFFSLANQTPAR